MAEAGPGPSSMASSPITPASAKQLRIKKRVVNLVNPADPIEFSAQSISPNSSVERSREMRREKTPSPDKFMLQEAAQTFTPLGFHKDGVRGILRPTGTPGSGNGVRFFPKNRFRVITPNQSINPAPSSPVVNVAPPSPASNSFLSQLLAVTMPSLSPLRPLPNEPTEESIEPDESWEVPGQEGEISLVASSYASERSQGDISQQIVEEDSWAGTPQIHSSPLGLTATVPDTSVDGYNDVELPSRDMQLPEDMSDLLTQKLSPPPDVTSFSISDFSRTSLYPAAGGAVSTEQHSHSSRNNASYGGSDHSTLSVVSEFNDSNPTIRRQLSPLPVRSSPALAQSPAVAAVPGTPTPTPSVKAFTSMFADMSAEQAQLTWPLASQASPVRSEVGVDETTFHSVMYTDISPLKTAPPATSTTPSVATPSVKTPGNITEYFDCDTPSPIIPLPSLTLSGETSSSGISSPLFGPAALVRPAKAMFDAHSAHATALTAELALYRKLATKLQEEVSERDGALADLNLRVVETELMKSRIEELEQELKTSRAEGEATSRLSRRNTSSPAPRHAPMTPEHPGNRTTAAEASNRDLEIRLAKALADQDALVSEMSALRADKDRQAGELDFTRNAVKRMEERERDAAVQVQRANEELRSQLEIVTKRERSLHAQLKEARVELEEAEYLRSQLEQTNKEAYEMERKLREMKEVKKADEEEVAKLRSEVENLEFERADLGTASDRLQEVEKMLEEERELRRDIEIEITQERHDREEEHQAVVDELDGELQQEKQRLEETEKEVEVERQHREELEMEIAKLRHSLEETKADLLARLNTPLSAPAGEVARLRAESASKDLEIVTLQRRKNELKEDVEMLNIALDSKQQELELIKRKFAVRGVAGATPLGTSRKANNLDTPAARDIETPLPGRAGLAARRRSSAAFITPSMGSVGNGKMLKGGHGTDLWKSNMAQRTMNKVDEENKPPVRYDSVRGSIRREQMLA